MQIWTGLPLSITRIWFIEVLPSSLNQPSIQGNLCDNEQSRKRTNSRAKKHSNRDGLKLISVDNVTTNEKLSHSGALLCIFEDNEAVIKMIMKGRSPTMRHVSRTHRVALDWLFGRTTLDPKNKSNMLTPRTNLPIS